MTAREIRDIIESEGYACYGIRGEYGIEYKVGDLCYSSHQWWQDDPGEESGLEYNEEIGCWDGGELPGTCALHVTEESDIDELVRKADSFGSHVTLIAGNCYEYGNDPGEVIIDDAIVLSVIR